MNDNINMYNLFSYIWVHINHLDMKTLVISFLCIVSINILIAQNKSISTVDINLYDHAISLKPTSDGGYIIIGSTGSNYYDTEFLYFKIDENYSLEWFHTLTSAQYSQGSCISKINNHEFMINGYGIHHTADYDALHLKINDEGELIADYSVLGNTHDYWMGVEYDNNENCLLYFGIENNESVIKKTDHDNNEIWTTNTSFFIKGLFSRQNEIIALARSSYVDPPFFNYLDLMKYDTMGNEIWHQQYGNYQAYSGNTLLPTADNGILFAGSVSNYDELPNIFIYKTDSLGNESWQNTIGDLYNWEICNDAIILNSELYLTGYKRYESENLVHPILLKLDQDGNVIWEKEYPIENAHAEILSILNISEDRLILAGYKSDKYSPYERDILIIETDLNGVVTSSSVIHKPILETIISPNPARNCLHINVHSEMTFDEIQIFGLNGTLLQILPFEESIDISDLSEGIYLVRFISENFVHTEKMTIQ